MSPGFVHLNLHSEFSLVDGILRIGSLIERNESTGHARGRRHRPCEPVLHGAFLPRRGGSGNQADHWCRPAARRRNRTTSRQVT